VFAVLIPTYVSSRVLKFPLNQYATATLIDDNASYFSPTKLTEMSPVTMEATYTLKGNAKAGSSSTAVWNEFTYVYDLTNHLPFQTMTRTIAFDRRTAQIINCCGSNVNGDSSIEQSGTVGYVFPIGTQKHTYDVFDANLNKPVPFTYQGTDTVNGLQAYRFVENVGPTQNGTQIIPGSLVGQSQASLTLPQFYQAHVTYWIDPDTGALLKANQDEKVFLENSSGAQALLLFNGNLAMTKSSVDGLVAIDNSQRSKKTAVETILPLVTGIVGAILLIVGILLSRKPREDVEAPLAAPAPAAAHEAAAHEAVPSAQPSLVPGLDDQPSEATPAADTPAHPEAAHPEAAHPEAAQPEAAQPEAAQPEAAAHEPQSEAAATEADAPSAPEAPTAELPAAPQPAAEPAESEPTMPPRAHRGAHRR
jgi:hypothetical protein